MNNMYTCKYCNIQFNNNHYCNIINRNIDSTSNNNNNDFLTSAAVGFATDNAILGALVGGDIIGGVVGEILSDSW